jgi:hypothetical protein
MAYEYQTKFSYVFRWSSEHRISFQFFRLIIWMTSTIWNPDREVSKIFGNTLGIQILGLQLGSEYLTSPVFEWSSWPWTRHVKTGPFKNLAEKIGHLKNRASENQTIQKPDKFVPFSNGLLS